MLKETYSWRCDANPDRELRITVNGKSVTVSMYEGGLLIGAPHRSEQSEAEITLVPGGDNDQICAALMGAAANKAAHATEIPKKKRA